MPDNAEQLWTRIMAPIILDFDDAVKILRLWGEAHREAGAVTGRSEGWRNHRGCLEMKMHVHTSDTPWCSLAAGEAPAPEPGVELSGVSFGSDSTTIPSRTPEPPAPESLAEHTSRLLEAPVGTNLTEIWKRHAEAIDGLNIKVNALRVTIEAMDSQNWDQGRFHA